MTVLEDKGGFFFFPFFFFWLGKDKIRLLVYFFYLLNLWCFCILVTSLKFCNTNYYL